MLLGIIRFLNLVISVSNIRLRYSGVIYDEHSSFIHFNNMEVPKEADSSENLHDKSRPGKLLIDLTRDCLVSATQYSTIHKGMTVTGVGNFVPTQQSPLNTSFSIRR